MQEFNKENYYKQGGSKLLQETIQQLHLRMVDLVFPFMDITP